MYIYISTYMHIHDMDVYIHMNILRIDCIGTVSTAQLHVYDSSAATYTEIYQIYMMHHPALNRVYFVFDSPLVHEPARIWGRPENKSSEERDRLLEKTHHALRPFQKTFARVAFPKWPGSFGELCLFDPALCHHPGSQLRPSPADRGKNQQQQHQATTTARKILVSMFLKSDIH